MLRVLRRLLFVDLSFFLSSTIACALYGLLDCSLIWSVNSVEDVSPFPAAAVAVSIVISFDATGSAAGELATAGLEAGSFLHQGEYSCIIFSFSFTVALRGSELFLVSADVLLTPSKVGDLIALGTQ